MRADPDDSPVRNPTAYPGDIPDHSYLLYGERYVRIETSPDRRLPKALVHELTSDIVGEAGHGRLLPLNFVLLRMNAATMNQRVPVLSVGSNAAPAQLALKFRSRGVNAVVPVIRARVQGLGIAYSAHLNAHGYLPAAPVGTDGEPLNALIAFLDDEQLNAVDDSEPNYTRVGISRATYPVVLDSGEEIERCCLYRGRHGIVESAAAAFGPFFDPTAMTPQRAVFDELLGGDPGLTRRLGVDSYDDLLRRAPELATIFTKVLTEAGLRADDRVRTDDSSARTYGESASRFAGHHRPERRDARSKTVLSTPRQAVRTGQPIVQLSHTLSEKYGDPRHVAVIREIDRRRYQSASHEMTVVAAVQRVPDTELDTAHVRVDQMLRHALGVEIQERVRVVPVSVPRASKGWVAPHRYVLMRVQVADINAVEQQACFMPATQLEILGISPGDVVVVESCTRAGDGPDGPDGPEYEVVTLRLKAYVASDDLIAQRQRNSGGGLNARYPSARDALGIYPDLPWIFLDAGSRELLGAHKLSALRVRAAQTYQLSKEMRELTILLMLAAVGASTQISNVWIAAALFALATIASVLFVFLRMRVRLCAVSGSPQVSRPYSTRHGTSVE